MRLFGLIGYPLGHSFSKKYFTDKFQREAITDCVYENFPIPSIDQLPALFKEHPSLAGLNITIPYKEEVVPYLEFKNDVVAKIGACNCIKVANGALHGYNTDVIGFSRSLKTYLLPSHRRALILGTGGAAKAVAFVLETEGIDYKLVSRSENRDSKNHVSYNQLTDELVASHTLIVNTTPLGMYPQVETYPSINYEMVGKEHYLYDLVYNPERTRFLKQGEENGATVKNGQDMLIIQAEESWRIWNDPEI